MIFWWRYAFIIPMTTIAWKDQPGCFSKTFGEVKIIIAKALIEPDKWHVLIIGALDNPREIFNESSLEEVIDQVKERLNI
jgi:hypothetical protein